MKILSLSLFGILLVFTTATGSAYNSITNQLFQITEAQLTNNNNNADVSLVSQRAYSDEYSFHIVGEVQNTGKVSAEFVEIVASFYDGNGQFVGTSYTFTNPTTVSPAMKAPFDIQLLTDDKIVKESKNYQLTLSWMNQGGKEMVKQYKSADLRQGQLQGQQQQQQSSSIIGINNNTLSKSAEASTTTTDISFGAKALQFLTYCNNQFSQTPVGSMTTDTLVFCTMVYDWYYMGCNSNNAILAPIIAAQCKDPIIIQQVNNYKTQIDIRIKQIVKIEVRPPRDGGGGGNNNTNQTAGNGSSNFGADCTAIGGCDGICSPGETNHGCANFGFLAPPDNDTSSNTLPPLPDPCIENPNAEGCPPPQEDLCKEDSNAEGCELALDPCIENPNAEGCVPPAPPPSPPPIDTGDKDDGNTDAGDTDTNDNDDSGGEGDDSGGSSDDSGDSNDGGDSKE